MNPELVGISPLGEFTVSHPECVVESPSEFGDAVALNEHSDVLNIELSGDAVSWASQNPAILVRSLRTEVRLRRRSRIGDHLTLSYTVSS